MSDPKIPSAAATNECPNSGRGRSRLNIAFIILALVFVIWLLVALLFPWSNEKTDPAAHNEMIRQMNEIGFDKPAATPSPK